MANSANPQDVALLAATMHGDEMAQLNAGQPVLVFLHGLLGDQHDWKSVIAALESRYCCLTIDLPGHGKSREIGSGGFEHTNALITNTIKHQLSGLHSGCGRGQGYWLVGYSLGGRLAMYHAAMSPPRTLQGLVIESGHPGLAESDRAARQEHDNGWARRFENEPLAQVLDDWYSQPVFSDLDDDQKQSLIVRRSANLGGPVAKMLRATSLSQQPLLYAQLKACRFPLYYLCGERDSKFSALAANSGFDFRTVGDAGHNIHGEQPEQFGKLVGELASRV